MLGAVVGLVEEGELKEGTDVGAVAGEGDEDGDIGGVVLGVLAVGVEVDGPVVAADGEGVAGDVLAHAHPLGKRVPSYRHAVRPVHRLRHPLRPRPCSSTSTTIHRQIHYLLFFKPYTTTTTTTRKNMKKKNMKKMKTKKNLKMLEAKANEDFPLSLALSHSIFVNGLFYFIYLV